ncbi:hypothetical protein GOP47_0003870 [Adiantum capillus-veneris]|uniref:Uncharacterized protein n=1 Tax=Adiantum capillus-veneris TaxID=13818 RepID=A0A9D4V733_ADICA|nr:hypothetical protein GOP47_0003870 [Adiantum capillus-veneris]
MFLAFNFRSETDLANVVEQRVWHSALEGDFENLPGKEWVELNKEIRSHMERWRRNLKLCWRRKVNELSGNESHRDALWSADLKILEAELKDINKKVLHYNLIVPFGRQVYSYSMEEELQQWLVPRDVVWSHSFTRTCDDLQRIGERTSNEALHLSLSMGAWLFS